MRLQEAVSIAEEFKSLLSPYCARCEVAGSVRRKKRDDIKDIEIVAVPDPQDLFGLRQAINNHCIVVRGRFPGRYLALKFRSRRVDLFITTPEQWGCIYLIRTGSAEFCRQLMTRAHGRGRRFRDGRLWDGVTALSTPEEADIFRALGMEYVNPEKRI